MDVSILVVTMFVQLSAQWQNPPERYYKPPLLCQNVLGRPASSFLCLALDSLANGFHNKERREVKKDIFFVPIRLFTFRVVTSVDKNSSECV